MRSEMIRSSGGLTTCNFVTKNKNIGYNPNLRNEDDITIKEKKIIDIYSLFVRYNSSMSWRVLEYGNALETTFC